MKYQRMDIKELRARTGLSQSKFAEEYGIPLGTLRHWETGERTAPHYVMDLLKRAVDTNNLNVTAWVFCEYRDKAGTGSTKTFKDKEDALLYAKDEWDHLCDADQESYKNDQCGEFWVSEMPMIWDDEDEEYYPDMSDYAPIWSAI